MHNEFKIINNVVQSKALCEKYLRILEDNKDVISLYIFNVTKLEENKIVFDDLKYSYGIRASFYFNGKLIDTIELENNNEDDYSHFIHALFYLHGYVDSFFEYVTKKQVNENEK